MSPLSRVPEHFQWVRILSHRHSFVSVNAYEFFENPPKGSTLARAPMLLNGFLISNRIPAFDTSNPVESVVQMLNKVGLYE